MRTPLLAVLFIANPSFAADVNSWLVGSWGRYAEGATEPMDIMYFAPDGTGATFDMPCRRRMEVKWHEYEGDIYAMNEFYKGPITITFRPSPDKKTMRYTGPTAEPTQISKLPDNPCGKL